MSKNNTIVYLTAIIAIAGIATFAFTFDQASKVEAQSETLIHAGGALPKFTVDFLSKETKHAIVGTVVSITPAEKVVNEEYSFTRIFSDVVIDVEKDLNSNYDGKQIAVRIQGGTMDGVTMTSENDAEFEVGEKVLIFLGEKEPDSIWGDNYYVAGLEGGKYSLSNSKAYGSEHPDGIDEREFVQKIIQSRAGN